MGRIINYIEIKDKKYLTLFDTGAKNTYVLKEIADTFPILEIEKPEPVSLGGKVHQVTKKCLIAGFLEGLPISFEARVLENIGKDDKGNNIAILIGALTMQEWGIVPVPEKETIDLTHYPKEFVEY
ncbi:MAG: hypothetical protein AB1349_07410 [Elusimicrobiota bacterium]